MIQAQGFNANLHIVKKAKACKSYFCVVGAFIELFTVMVCLSFLVAMYSKKETGNL